MSCLEDKKFSGKQRKRKAMDAEIVLPEQPATTGTHESDVAAAPTQKTQTSQSAHQANFKNRSQLDSQPALKNSDMWATGKGAKEAVEHTMKCMQQSQSQQSPPNTQSQLQGQQRKKTPYSAQCTQVPAEHIKRLQQEHALHVQAVAISNTVQPRDCGGDPTSPTAISEPRPVPPVCFTASTAPWQQQQPYGMQQQQQQVQQRR